MVLDGTQIRGSGTHIFTSTHKYFILTGTCEYSRMIAGQGYLLNNSYYFLTRPSSLLILRAFALFIKHCREFLRGNGTR
jgi:hypothetical protein